MNFKNLFLCGLMMLVLSLSNIYSLPVFAQSNSKESTTTKKWSLQDFKKVVKKGMSFSEIEKSFGKPDKDVGSGIYIFVYPLDDGSSILLGFSTLNHLRYAKHKTVEGKSYDIIK